jgi:hypothetical protein
MIIDPSGGVVTSVLQLALTMLVTAAVAASVGYLIGKLVAEGQLLNVLRHFGNDLSGFASDSGAQTLRRIESIYAFLLRTCVTLCATFGLWTIAFGFKLPVTQDYQEWHSPFLIFWVISFMIFIFGIFLPIRIFDKRLDEIYGDANGINQMQTQFNLAKKDAVNLDEKIKITSEPLEHSGHLRQINDLKGFTTSSQMKAFRQRALQPPFLWSFLISNIVAFIGTLTWSYLAQD